MKHVLLKTTITCALACAATGASAVGRVADVNVIDRSTGVSLPVHLHRGEYWIAGQPGAKYSIQIRNKRGPRLLAVMSVDGLNVLTGETADFGQSGYVFESGQRYGIEGWRKTDSEVAAFVFTASGDSYAERIGKARDMGVIGVALFRERPPVAVFSPPVLERRQEAPATAGASSADNAMERSSKPSQSSVTPSAPSPSPKLGTAHGERENSLVTRTQFVRNSSSPDEVIRIRYDSHANLMAMGIIPNPHNQPVPNPFPGSPVGYVPDPPAWR